MSEVEFAILDAGPTKLELGLKRRGRSQPRDEWVKLHGRVRAIEGEWSFADSSRMIEEVEQFGNWLLRWSESTAEPAIRFLEGNLSAEATRDPAGNVLLRVRFRGEISPPWLWGDGDAVWDTGYWLDLKVTQTQLRTFGSRVKWLVNR